MIWLRRIRRSRASTLWLVKDDPDGSWWCDCPQGIVDAPWHNEQTFPTDGGGWLFTCVRCTRAFMFTRAVRIRKTLEDLAAQCTPRTQQVYDPQTDEEREEILLADPKDWLAIARPLAEGLVEGQRYVFLDGRVLPAVHGPIQFKGLWRSHDLPDLPHIAEPPISDVLDDPDYWLAERDG